MTFIDVDICDRMALCILFSVTDLNFQNKTPDLGISKTMAVIVKMGAMILKAGFPCRMA